MDKNKKQWRRRMLIIGTTLALLAYGGYEHVYVPQYEIMDESCQEFACYSQGRIFIGNKSFLARLKNLREGDILVLDQRDGDDPNMKIISSCDINNKDIRNEILEVLCRYEEMYPSKWDRTIESMRLEWLMHNLSYDFNNQQHRTKDVDLNNGDQDYYDNWFLNLILKIYNSIIYRLYFSKCF